MRPVLQKKILDICNRKIAEKGLNVGLSFYAFFANKNDDPDLLMEAAQWWIKTNQLDHFEKATKIKALVLALIDTPNNISGTHADQARDKPWTCHVLMPLVILNYDHVGGASWVSFGR